MKKYLVFLGIIIILAACSTDPVSPTATPVETLPETAVTEPSAPEATAPPAEITVEATETPLTETTEPETATETEEVKPLPENLQMVNYEGISFHYDTSLATNVLAETVPGAEKPIDGPGWANPPTHDRFTFEDYILPESYPNATIYVFPVNKTASRSSHAKDQIELLQTMLAERPAPNEITGQLPYLPLQPASQMFAAQFEYMSFGSGEGIRYLTALSQAVFPVTNQGLRYTFQGLTNDGEYYVTAVFPIHTDSVPDNIPPDFDMEDFTANYDARMQESVDLLNGLENASFTPDLTLLNDATRSITIEKERPPRHTDANGNLLLTLTYPVNNGQVVLGDELTITGYADPASTEPISVTLSAGTNVLVETTTTPDAATGDWQTTFIVPNHVAGRGMVTATMGEQTDSALVYLDDIRGVQYQGETQIRFFRPYFGETAVSGYPVFFEGEVVNSINDTVTVGVLIDNCTTWTARQEFTVVGGGIWNGIILLPDFIEDEQACASVYTGMYGENWIETQSSLPVLAPDNERANRLYLSSSLQLEFQAGGMGRIEGVAVEAPEVQVALLNNEDRTVIVEGTAPVGDFGAWEIELPIPEDAPELVTVEITILDDPPLETPYVYTTGATILR